ncbi:hypothetical protein GY45DRAFT_1375884 [Cubamyces sp. BRFM 1775]|nr:hypothetical protein GY45DRAFT_1375884 [Cubamyces sp. BRFM 1775]
MSHIYSDATAREYAARRPPLSIVTFMILPDITLACIMALRPPFAIRLGVSLLLIFAAIYATATYTLGAPVSDYSMGSVGFANTVLNITLFTWLADPIKDFRYIKEPAPLTAKPFIKRLWYSICIIQNRRLVGTNVQVANVPPLSSGSRWRYLRRRVRQLLVGMAILDVVESWIHTHRDLYMPATAPLHFSAGLRGFLERSACMVPCRGDPECWPDLFGNLSDAYTLRNLWGKVWHQSFRRHFCYLGKAVVRVLHIPRGTWLSSQVQIHVAFLLSAFLHCMGDLMIGKEHLGRSLSFFIVNGMAITFEDTVIALAKRAGYASAQAQAGRPSYALRMLGYAWVLLWCMWSGPIYKDWLLESGVHLGNFLPYSPVRSWILPTA